MRLPAGLVALTLIAGCGGGNGEGGLSAEDSRELDNAAAMLDASPDDLVADDAAILGNGEEAAPVTVNEAAAAQ